MKGNWNKPEWNEADWEKEICRDEGRINRYFHDLPVCIDLPDEEEFIFADIASIPELIPGNTTSEEWKKLRRFEDGPDSEEDDSFEQCKSDDECIALLDKLSVNWSLLAVDKLDRQLWLKSAGITCGFAKLISSVENFNAADKNAELALKKILGKRMLKDLDMLSDLLSATGAVQKSIQHETESFANSLARLRALLENRLAEL